VQRRGARQHARGVEAGRCRGPAARATLQHQWNRAGRRLRPSGGRSQRGPTVTPTPPARPSPRRARRHAGSRRRGRGIGVLTGRSDAHSLRLVSTASRIARISGAFLVLALALVSHPACRSSGGRRPDAPSGPNADAERALVGQQRLLRFYGKKKSVSVSLDKAGQGSGECDVAVEVKTAAFDVGKATFTLATIGQPRLEGRPRERPGKKSRCRKLPAQTSLVISGLESDSTDKLIAGVGEVLLTPEDYLRAHGTRFDRPPSADPKEVADPSPTGVLAEQRRRGHHHQAAPPTERGPGLPQPESQGLLRGADRDRYRCRARRPGPYPEARELAGRARAAGAPGTPPVALRAGHARWPAGGGAIAREDGPPDRLTTASHRSVAARAASPACSLAGSLGAGGYVTAPGRYRGAPSPVPSPPPAGASSESSRS